MKDKIIKLFKNIEYNNLYPLFFTIIFILILIQYSFNSLDAILYDLWVRADITSTINDDVIVITLDEESDQFLGEVYPYSYATHSRFINRLLDEKPAIVNFLVSLTDPSEEEQKYLDDFKQKITNFIQEGGDFSFGTIMDAWGEQLPPEQLRTIDYSLALINTDDITFAKDDVSRRTLLNVSGDDTIDLWAANAYRRMKGADEADSNSFNGSYYNAEADATFVMYRYGTNPLEDKTKIISIPYHRVVVGNFSKNFFKDKLIFIGSKYLSNSGDYVYTPFDKENEKAPKIFVHSLITQALINQNTVKQIPNFITDFLAVFIAIFLSFIISKVQPTRGLIITVGIMISMFIMGYGLFIAFGLWLKLSHIILSIFVVYYIWVPFRAIGEYQTRYAIEEETKLLKKVDNLKQNFISLMSHDLKTPVAKIAGIADILRVQYDNTTDQERLIDNIINSTKELNKFITSILDLTKIESQNLSIQKTSKDINSLIEDICGKLKFESTFQDITIHQDLSPLYPITMDIVLINRVLSNLIENALKYSGAGSKIDVKTWDDEAWVYVQIQDNGVGIKPEDIDHIFEKFYRVKNDSTHVIKGSGLGLYLVKYFIELHEGQISVESTLGEGTKFLVKLKNA